MTTDPCLPWSAEPPEEGDVRVRVLDCTGAAIGVMRDLETAQAVVAAAMVAGGPRCCEYLVAWSNVYNAPVLFHQMDCRVVPPPLTIQLLNGSLVSFSEGVNEPLEPVFGVYTPDLGSIPGGE